MRSPGSATIPCGGRGSGVAVLAVALLLSACGVMLPSGVSSQSPAAAPAPTEGPERPPTRTLAAGASVFVVVMENRSAAAALARPYTAELARRFALAANYRALSHPSLPNYLALTSGSTFGIQDDGYHLLPRSGIGDQLERRGISWRAYMEGLTGDCRQDHGRYVVRHDPFAYYGGTCPGQVVSFGPLDADLAGAGTPRFAWITPDTCHDGHDCSARDADAFLARLVPKILASPAWTRGGVLLLTWDEDDGETGNQVTTIVASPELKAQRSDRPYDHYSLLATTEDLLRVPRLGAANQAQAFDDLL